MEGMRKGTWMTIWRKRHWGKMRVPNLRMVILLPRKIHTKVQAYRKGCHYKKRGQMRERGYEGTFVRAES